MFITKKYISRRTVLKGAGVAVSLPFLGVSSLNFGPLATVAFFLVWIRSA